MKPTDNPHNQIPEIMDFHRASFAATAQEGYHAYADACERYTRMNRAGYDDLRQMASEFFSGAALTYILQRIDSVQIDHLMKQGRALGAEIKLQPAIVDQPTEPNPPVVLADEPLRSERHAKFEIDLYRICYTRGDLLQWRFWVYGHAMGDGSGKIEKPALFDFLQRIGVVSSRRNFDHILAGGMGLYWNIDYKRGDGMIYLTGQQRLNKRITALELKKAPHTVGISAPGQTPVIMRSLDTNRPGSVYVWSDISGKPADVRAALYATWISVKAQKHGYIELSRRVLQALWKTPRKTLIQWEKRAKLKHADVYCESTDPHDPLVPSYAYPALDGSGNEIATWRESNRYFPNPVDIHNHGGQRRKIRRAVNAKIENAEPAFDNGGGLRRTGRINFEHERVSAKCVAVRADGSKHYTQVITPPEKLLKQHVNKDAKKGLKPHRHMLTTGTRYNVVIKELSTGYRLRSIGMQRDLHAESTAEYRQRISQYRMGWTDRCV